MRRIVLLVIIGLLSLSASAQYTVIGGVGNLPYQYTPEGGTGISKIYLLNTFLNATISYDSRASVVRFYTYTQSLSDRQLVPAGDITSSTLGDVTTYTITNLQDGRGYMAEEDGVLKSAVWIIDYSMHLPVLTSISVIESDDKCQVLKLLLDKDDELFYYANNGSPRRITRNYWLEYNTKAWSDESGEFEAKAVSEKKNYGTEIIIDAPLADTQFLFRGDEIAQHFGISRQILSANYSAIAVQARSTQKQVSRESETELDVPSESGLGGSAPVQISFFGHSNEPVTRFYTWFIYHKKNPNTPIIRRTEKNLDYTFTEAGDYRVVLEVADRTSVCADTLSLEFNVSESFLDVPNYFSPDASPGVNDEFRVVYKSLIRFKCTIFNRWGNKLFEWTDPAMGWDGKYKGNYVSTGVYYYAIDAEGSDGIKYKKGGDINILRSR